MGNPMIEITENLSVRANKIEVIEVHECVVWLSLNAGPPQPFAAKDHQHAREMRDTILAQINAGEAGASREVRTQKAAVSIEFTPPEDLQNTCIVAKPHTLSRQEKFNRLTEVIISVMGDSDVSLTAEALWVAMQMICGPQLAAQSITNSQVRL